MYPHERSLVSKLQDRPFALLGVNSDRSREELQKAMQKENITWRSWWDGPPGGPIAVAYDVTNWPTIFLIDHKGNIRYHYVGVPGKERLEKAIHKLLQEAEQDQKRLTG